MPAKTKKKSQCLNRKTHNDDFGKKYHKPVVVVEKCTKIKHTYEPRSWIQQWRWTKTLTLGGTSSPFVFSLRMESRILLSSFLLSSFLPSGGFFLSFFLSFFFLFSFLLSLRNPLSTRKPNFQPFQFWRPNPLSKTCFLPAQYSRPNPLSKTCHVSSKMLQKNYF